MKVTLNSCVRNKQFWIIRVIKLYLYYTYLPQYTLLVFFFLTAIKLLRFIPYKKTFQTIILPVWVINEIKSARSKNNVLMLSNNHLHRRFFYILTDYLINYNVGHNNNITKLFPIHHNKSIIFRKCSLTIMLYLLRICSNEKTHSDSWTTENTIYFVHNFYFFFGCF